MLPNHWLLQLSQRWFQSNTRRRRRVPCVPVMRRRHVKPILEPLEDRLLLSATITDLGVLPGDGYSTAFGINQSGQVVGESWSVDSETDEIRGQHAFEYSNGQMTDLNTLLPSNSGWVLMNATGINTAAQIVGDGTINGPTHAFLYSGGQITDLGTLPGGDYSQATGINEPGQVVGGADTISGAENAFLYSNSQMKDLGTLPGYENSIANGITAVGQVVGESWSENPDTFDITAQHAFLYSNGQMTDLGTFPGYTYSTAMAINASGQVVGESSTSSMYSGNGVQHAYLYSNGQMIDLGTLPGDTSSSVAAINASGQVVGNSWSVDNGGNSQNDHVYLYSNGQMTDLNSLLPTNSGWMDLNPETINDSGQIVGTGFINGQQHAFLLDLPLPEVMSNPINQKVTAGGTAAFTATVSGTPTPTVQWYVNSGSGWNVLNNGGNVSGATSTTLTLTNVTTAMNGYEYQAAFTNIYGTTFTSAATLLVNPAITFSPGSGNLADGMMGTAYNQTITASGGTGDLTLNDKLTNTLGLNFLINGSTLTISGTPNASGNVSFSITATDTNGATATANYTLTVNAPITFSPSRGNLATSIAGTSYNQTIIASGGSGNVTLNSSLTPGFLPAGLNLTGSGSNTLTISGTPIRSGSVSFSVTATDSNGDTQTANFTLTISQAPTTVIAGSATVNFSGGAQSVNLTVVVSSPSGLVNSGNVIVLLNGSQIGSAAVSNGLANVPLIIPSGLAAGTYTLTEEYTGSSSFQGSSASGTLTINPPPQPPPHLLALNVPPLVAFFDSLLGASETVNANGTETLTANFLDIPLLVSTFDSSGNLESVLLFGMNVTALFESL